MRWIAIWIALPVIASAQTFRRPTACDDCIAGWFYFDGNGVAAGDEDWNCGTSSYDGHRGTDFSLRGGNGEIDTGYDIVAAADGVVRLAIDGFYDRCTMCGGAMCGLDFGSGFGNHVNIDHGDHTVVYAHMRMGSVRVRAGDIVHCGDVIGQIGSSGCTTGAHVHFEVRPLAGASTAAFDSFAGACSTTATSTWTSQGAYRSLPSPACDGPSSDGGTSDAGSDPDAGSAQIDAGIAIDAAQRIDAGGATPLMGGCGCRASPRSSALLSLLITLLALLAFRTSRTSWSLPPPAPSREREGRSHWKRTSTSR